MEMEKKFENTLAFLSVAQMGSNPEKNRGRKSRDTLLSECHAKIKCVNQTDSAQFTSRKSTT